jgi:3'(2'), 5'-bisphosphate nucleotidase
MLEREEKLACELVREVGDWVQSVAGTGLESRLKGDRSVVTSADLEADERICSELRSVFPLDAVLSEESGFSGKRGSTRVWVVDPIDGTSAFVLGESGYRVQVGLLVDGKPALGVVYDPQSGRVSSARRGGGAWAMDVAGERVPLKVSSEREWEKTRVTLSANVNSVSREALCQSTGLCLGPVTHGTGAKMTLVAAGLAEVYFSGHPLSYWDTLAPLVIAEEAGATASLLCGDPLQYDLDRGRVHRDLVVVSHGVHHEKAIAALSRWQSESEIGG